MPGLNACSTAWRDFKILLQEKSLFLVIGNDELLDPTDLIKNLQGLNSDRSNVDTSIRYAIAASPELGPARSPVHATPSQAKTLN